MEIYWSGTWGAISDSSWTPSEANIVCRQLQHSVNGNFFLAFVVPTAYSNIIIIVYHHKLLVYYLGYPV